MVLTDDISTIFHKSVKIKPNKYNIKQCRNEVIMKEMNLKRALEKINTNEKMDTRIMETLLKERKSGIKKWKKRRNYSMSYAAVFSILIVFGTVATVAAAINQSYRLQGSKNIEFSQPVEYVRGEDGSLEPVIDEETEREKPNYIDCESVEKAFEIIQEENWFPTYIPDDRKFKNVRYVLKEEWKLIWADYTGTEAGLQKMSIFYSFHPGQEVEPNEDGVVEIQHIFPGGEYEEESRKAMETVEYSEYVTKNGLNCLISSFENPSNMDDVTICVQLESGILEIGIAYHDTWLEQEELYKILDSIPEIH